jgi:hypothetical protein
MTKYLIALTLSITAIANQQTTTPTPPPPTTTPTTNETTTTTTPTTTTTTSNPPPAQRGNATQTETTTTIPQPKQWTGPIPAHYGGNTGCTQQQANIIANTMWTAGANDNSIEKMLGIISRESTCDPAAFNGNRNTGDQSYGLCQINALAGWYTGPLSHYNPHDFATNFTLNAQACTELWTLCGFGPWNYGNYYCRTPQELQ